MSLIYKELTTKEEILEGFPVMRQLRTHLDEETYLSLVQEAQKIEGYQQVALVDNNEIVAIVGFQPMITLYNGKFIWVCDLVTAAEKRSNGYGEKLLNYVHHWAKEHHFECVSLSSGLQRLDAHRFYEEKMGYEKVSFVFLKKTVD